MSLTCRHLQVITSCNTTKRIRRERFPAALNLAISREPPIQLRGVMQDGERAKFAQNVTAHLTRAAATREHAKKRNVRALGRESVVNVVAKI